jgi:hypothetical protein
MPIPTVRTQYLVKEMPTDGHAPMAFYCDDGRIYYCKYLLRLKKREELDCLTYEMVAQRLLRSLAIPTPDIAFVEVTKDSFDSKMLRLNRTNCRPGVICFGSQHLQASLLTPLETISDKHDFNRFANPLDLLRIALFDQWVGNVDRGRAIDEGHNFNLLLTETESKTRYVAFDHAFIFGGVHGLRMFNAKFVGYQSDSLLQCQYFRSVLRYISVEECQNAIAHFFVHLRTYEWKTVTSDTLAQCAAVWPHPPNLEERITSFLGDPDRLNKLEEIICQRVLQHRL